MKSVAQYIYCVTEYGFGIGFVIRMFSRCRGIVCKDIVVVGGLHGMKTSKYKCYGVASEGGIVVAVVCVMLLT